MVYKESGVRSGSQMVIRQLRSRLSALPAVIFVVLLLMPMGLMAQESTSVTLSPGFQFTSVTGVSGGDAHEGGVDVNVSTYGGSPTGTCSGVVKANPNHNIIIRADISLTIGAVSTDGGAISLFVQGPQGVHCSDMRQGNMSSLTRSFRPGTYSLFVASELADGHHPYILTFNELAVDAVVAQPVTQPVTQPPVTQPPVTQPPVAVPTDGSLSPGFGSMNYTGVSGGSVNGRNFGTSVLGLCTGYIPNTPNHTITLNAPMNLSINVTPNELADTTLIIQGPEGLLCNDDFQGVNPGMVRMFSAGTYSVYVGSYVAGRRHAYNMVVREMGGHPTAGASLVVQAPAQGGALSQGFRSYTERGVSGGTTDGRANTDQLGQPCVGWYGSQANHTLNLASSMRLTITATPEQVADTTMMIRGPDGTFCNDDFEGVNPGFNRQFQSGTYQIFVGSYVRGWSHPYTLNVLE